MEIPEDLEDPVSTGRANAIGWHQVWQDYMDAGFDSEQAFKLMHTQFQEYWGAAYAVAMSEEDR